MQAELKHSSFPPALGEPSCPCSYLEFSPDKSSSLFFPHEILTSLLEHALCYCYLVWNKIKRDFSSGDLLLIPKQNWKQLAWNGGRKWTDMVHKPNGHCLLHGNGCKPAIINLSLSGHKADYFTIILCWICNEMPSFLYVPCFLIQQDG